MTRALKIVARPAIFVIAELRRRGVPTDDLLRQVALRRTDLADPEARVPYSAVIGLIERAAALTGDASFGLRLGASRDQHDSGLLGFVLLNSSTLMDALANLRRYFRVVGDGEEFEIERGGPLVTLRFRETEPDLRGLRQNSDYIASMLVRACRDMTRRRVSPVRAEFIHGRPNQKVEYADLLDCPVRFNAEWDSLVYPAEAMRLPVVGANNKLLKVLQEACRMVVGPTPRKHDIVHDVRELIIDKLTKGTAQLDEIARELNMSSKTMERRLAERATTFSALLEEVRSTLAKRYLRESDYRLEQIAYLTGFSEPAALVRAFKRWTGTTPIRFRQQQIPG